MPGPQTHEGWHGFGTHVRGVARDDGNVPLKRLPGFDYSSAGAYFVTVCTHRRASLFGSAAAAIAVQACWDEIPSHFPVELDAFVVMPNHVHGIVVLPRVGHARPLQTIVGTFKSAAARSVNRLRGTPGEPVWQRGYFERVVRSERELEALRGYVLNNPDAWYADPENPCRTARLASAPWL